jgi:hypothetical protein
MNPPPHDIDYRADKERILAILNSWHKIEFFIPFDLEGSVIQDTHQYKRANWLHEDSLRQGERNFNFRGVPTARSKILFISCVFDKTSLLQLRQGARTGSDPNDTYENKERGDLEGATCFARIKLNELGEPLYDEISISTLHGHWAPVQRAGLEGLHANGFALAQGRFGRRITELGQPARNHRHPASADSQRYFRLCDLLYSWAQFTPENTIASAVIQWQESYGKSSETDEDDGQGRRRPD